MPLILSDLMHVFIRFRIYMCGDTVVATFTFAPEVSFLVSCSDRIGNMKGIYGIIDGTGCFCTILCANIAIFLVLSSSTVCIVAQNPIPLLQIGLIFNSDRATTPDVRETRKRWDVREVDDV